MDSELPIQLAVKRREVDVYTLLADCYTPEQLRAVTDKDGIITY